MKPDSETTQKDLTPAIIISKVSLIICNLEENHTRLLRRYGKATLL